MRGFDLLFYMNSAASRANQRSSERAIAWTRAGGLVNLCCHMFMDLGSPPGNPQLYAPGANGNAIGTISDIRQAVIIDGTPENRESLAKLDIIATELKNCGTLACWRSGGRFTNAAAAGLGEGRKKARAAHSAVAADVRPLHTRPRAHEPPLGFQPHGLDFEPVIVVSRRRRGERHQPRRLSKLRAAPGLCGGLPADAQFQKRPQARHDERKWRDARSRPAFR